MPSEMKKTQIDQSLVVEQAAFGPLSVGQLKDLVRHCRMPEATSITAPKIRMYIFLSENQMSCGTEEMRPAKVAPAPRMTNNAGKAQQTKVLNEENSVRNELRRFTG